ncbi:hypothetical protein D9757_002967 [Collybiopsis confluens]|uniref:Uncharacterized protein n=1 Tax=Collybiopsis confluens TaxID=2823264 RepID=A0A8H5HVS3_9AGAR|nr:hypothetical protein D9757_002967 [Collybiopsis confluens]
MSSVPKAVLYYSQISIWSSAVLLTLEEKGYGRDELGYKLVDLGKCASDLRLDTITDSSFLSAKGENYSLSFLRLNSKATVPTLIVPLRQTLSQDVESRYKALTNTKDIVEFLDKSRSSLSSTNTTSNAPAPTLAPATLSFSSTCKLIIEDVLHSDNADPNHLLFMNARDQVSLTQLADNLLPFMKGKISSLETNLTEAQAGTVRASEKVVDFWTSKKNVAQVLAGVYESASKTETELDENAKTRRLDYFKTAKTAWEVALPTTLLKLTREIIGPFALGEFKFVPDMRQSLNNIFINKKDSLADPHLTAWLARVFSLVGGTSNDSGATVIEKLEKHIGDSTTSKMESPTLGKLATYWDAVKERPSFKKVYVDGLH